MDAPEQTWTDVTGEPVTGSGDAVTATGNVGPWTWAPAPGVTEVITGAGTCSATPADAADVPTWLTARTLQVPVPWWLSSTSSEELIPPGSVTNVLSPPGERCSTYPRMT